MLKPVLILLVLLCQPGLGLLMPGSATAQAETAIMSVTELMEAAALDEVFTQFGPAFEASPRLQGMPFDVVLDTAWVEAARETFDAGSMHAALAAALDDRFTSDEQRALSSFFHSGFGRRITALERSIHKLDPDAQLAAHTEGLSLLADIAEGSRRDLQYDEMATLVSADIALAMISQSMRGMLVGISLSEPRGDIEIPWQEIEAQVAEMLPAIEAEVAMMQRAIMAFAYRDLQDAELDIYLEFLRTPAARRFYAVANYSVGLIVTDAMTVFGRRLASKIGKVNI